MSLNREAHLEYIKVSTLTYTAIVRHMQTYGAVVRAPLSAN